MDHRLAQRVAQTFLVEKRGFVSNPLVYLMKYLNSEDWEKGAEMVADNESAFVDWLKENPSLIDDNDDLQQDVESGYLNDDAWDLPHDLLSAYYHEFKYGLGQSSFAPSWVFMEDPKIVKNQWLIHFTNDAGSVACQGFKYGMADVTMLGLTTHFKNEMKSGGYNFAYDIKNWERYASGRFGFKYGKEAVMFKASGVKVWHNGDNEEQVVFIGSTAKDIVPLTEYGGDWYANGIGRGGREEGLGGDEGEAFESLSEAVDWVHANFNQYKRLLVC